MLREFAPWTRERELIPRGDAINPVLTLNREMNQLFDRLYRGGYDPEPAYRTYPAYSGAAAMTAWPKVEVEETEAGYKVSAELPGLDEKDVEVLIDDDGLLTLRGDKRVAHEGAAFSERMYGRFERMIALGDVDAKEGCKATFKNGVLSVFLPKAAQASQKTRRIPVNEAVHPEAPAQGASKAGQGEAAASVRQAA